MVTVLLARALGVRQRRLSAYVVITVVGLVVGVVVILLSI
jgi:hypothetical protein